MRCSFATTAATVRRRRRCYSLAFQACRRSLHFPRPIGVIPLKLAARRVYGHESDPLVMEQVLEHSVPLNDRGDSADWSLKNRQQSHGFVKMFLPVVNRLQREPRLKIALGTEHHSNA